MNDGVEPDAVAASANTGGSQGAVRPVAMTAQWTALTVDATALTGNPFALTVDATASTVNPTALTVNPLGAMSDATGATVNPVALTVNPTALTVDRLGAMADATDAMVGPSVGTDASRCDARHGFGRDGERSGWHMVRVQTSFVDSNAA